MTPAGPAHSLVTTPDGRVLEVVVEGDPEGFPLLFHHGSPSAVAPNPLFDRAARQRGIRLVSFTRPGYAGSTPRPGRSVADVVTDVEAVCAAVASQPFVALGWSGGGPHALACAALLPGRCVGAASLAGVAPFDAEGLDWLAGMGDDNRDEFGAAVVGEQALTAYLELEAADLVDVSGEQVAAALGDLVSPIDVAALTGEVADYLAAALRRSVSEGVAGWRDDDLAFVRGWGFDLQAVEVPVSVWQGGQDRMVPYAHGRWLAEHVAGARAHLYEDEGHISLGQQVGRIMDDLLELAGHR